LTLDQLSKAGPRGVEFPMQYMFSILPRGVEGSSMWLLDLLSGVAFWLVFLLIPPLLTMRLFAEEKATGTLEVLMTSPLRDWQVVLSKYLACFAFYVVLWLPTLFYLPMLIDLQPPTWQPAWTFWSIVLLSGIGCIVLAGFLLLLPLGTLSRFIALLLVLTGGACIGMGGWGHYYVDSTHLMDLRAGIDPWPVLSSYLGVFLAGAMFLALGMLISSLVNSQIVAALVSVLLSLGFIVAGLWRRDMESGGALSQVLYSFSVPLHVSQDFGRGLVDTRHLVLYGSVTLFCLFLTVRSLESRRWH
jgi:ABC-type transport system involved in multi-copper enzyme maturation permease subunit